MKPVPKHLTTDIESNYPMPEPAYPMPEAKSQTEKRVFKSGATSTKQPRLSLIPHKGLVNAAVRFELGLNIHGQGAYNALSPGDQLDDADWLIERCSHAIEHAYSMIDILKKIKGPKCINDYNEMLAQHAGAVAWCGLVLGEAALQDKD